MVSNHLSTIRVICPIRDWREKFGIFTQEFFKFISRYSYNFKMVKKILLNLIKDDLIFVMFAQIKVPIPNLRNVTLSAQYF